LDHGDSDPRSRPDVWRIQLGPIQIADCQSFRFRPVREYNNFTDMTALRPNARGW